MRSILGLNAYYCHGIQSDLAWPIFCINLIHKSILTCFIMGWTTSFLAKAVSGLWIAIIDVHTNGLVRGRYIVVRTGALGRSACGAGLSTLN